MKQPNNDDLYFRLGAAALGGIAGIFFGFVLAILVSVLFHFELNFAPYVFGSGLVGFFLGLIVPQSGFDFSEGVLHFFIGLFWSVLGSEVSDHSSNVMLKIALFVGCVVGIVFYLLH